MANDFVRLPDEGEDDGVWADFADPNIRASILGRYTARLYNDAGVLKISKGRIGTDDGTNEGVARIDTITTINMAAVSNGNWAKIEMSIVGAAVTFAAADIVGATTNVAIPSTVKTNYDPEKGGYYLVATKRLIGIAYKDGSGNLSYIYNCEDGILGFKETELISGYDSSLALSDVYIRKVRYEIGAWNMDANAQATVSVKGAGAEIPLIRSIKAIIQNDASTAFYVLYAFVAGGTIDGGISILTPATGLITLDRTFGGVFDSVNFDDAVMNRGWIIIELEV